MTRYKPMLAVPMKVGQIADWSDWFIERKYDGHRILVEVTAPGGVIAWARPRGSGRPALRRDLPPHLVADFTQLPYGVYDGELLGGRTSTDVTRTDLQGVLRFVIFDILEHQGQDVTGRQYSARRALLVSIMCKVGHIAVSLAQAVPLNSNHDAVRFVKQVWDEGGEGAIIKRADARYQCGKRSPDWIKVKKLQHETMTVVGFAPSRGVIMKRGQFGIVVVRDDRGNYTSVKTKDDDELQQFEREGKAYQPQPFPQCGIKNASRGNHPAIGRQLVIEYQDFTPLEGYRHPRWDHWE